MSFVSPATPISNKLQEPVRFLVFSASLRNLSLNSQLELIIQTFMDLAEASKNYPCAKKAWFEYLGEQPEAVTARAQ